MTLAGYVNNKISCHTYMHYTHTYALFVNYVANINEIKEPLRRDVTKIVSSSLFINMATNSPT